MIGSSYCNIFRNSEVNTLNESMENVSEPIKRTMRVFNLTEKLRVSEAGIRLSVDTECI
jgi:hypothetical protein